MLVRIKSWIRHCRVQSGILSLTKRNFSSAATIKVTQSSTNLKIDIPDKTSGIQQYSYPYPWLRDNCQCGECYLHSAKSRLFLISNLDLNVRPTSVHSSSKDSIKILWSDGHVSTYGLDWLQAHRFTQDNAESRRRFFRKPTIMWGEEMNGNIPKVKYADLLEDKKSLYDFLVGLEETGIQLITGAPTQTGVVSTIAQQVAFLKKTNYGETFTVKSKWNASNVAFTGVKLGLHTDLPYYHYMPGVQMLHCISQTQCSGGENIFADGFYAATIMKNEYPQQYTILKDTPIDHHDEGVDAYKFHKLNIVPVIQEDIYGHIDSIRYNDATRDSLLSLPLDQVFPLYGALSVYDKLVHGRRCRIQHRLKNGEILVFHNYRVLHGRNGYSGERHLEGGYIDWDELRSKRRVLEEELQAPTRTLTCNNKQILTD